MSKIISIANTKGGVGKTTTAIYLGIALSKYGTVKILDGDMQGSATEWIENIERDLPFFYEVANKRTFHKKHDCDYIIIDTPPQSSDVIKEAANVSDIVIIPMKATSLDLQRTVSTIELLSPEKEYRVLLTMTIAGTQLLRETQDYFKEEDISFFDVTIPRRENIAKSIGYIPTELYSYDEIAEQIK